MAVTEADVIAILGPEYSDLAEATVTPFLGAATLVRTEDLASSGLTSARLDLIEKFLAAHFVIVAYERGGLTKQTIGESSDTYKEGMESNVGFLMTHFGQQAVSLDTSGTLALNAVPTQKAEFRVVTAASSEKYGNDASPD